MKHHLFVLIVFIGFLSACHSNRLVDVKQASDLQHHIGDPVRLEGFLSGPGKPSDYIVIRGGWVYLTGNMNTGDEEIKRGKPIVAEGTLRYQTYSQRPTARFGVRSQQLQDHFYIHNAKVRVNKPPLAPSRDAPEPSPAAN
jgi:hypothetical protein